MKKRITKKPLNETKLRQFLRREIYRLMEAEETEEVPQEEPAPEEEEEGLSADFEDALNLFMRKLRSSKDSVGDDDLIEMISTVISFFVTSNESKLNILKQIRNNIIQ